jgi:hypothetical protein
MSTEEFGALLNQDMSEHVISQDMAMAEVHELIQEWTGWSADDLEDFADTLAIETKENSTIQQEAKAEDTAELEGRKEEAVIGGHPRMTPVVARKVVQTKPTIAAQPAKLLVQSLLKAAVKKGTAKRNQGKVLKPAATEQPKAVAVRETQS